MALICAAIAVPIGILGAIYLIEYARGTKVAHAVSFSVDILSGIPSIVAALFIYALFITIAGPLCNRGVRCSGTPDAARRTPIDRGDAQTRTE
jgi:ABC-type phosphate transport system permease subunit